MELIYFILYAIYWIAGITITYLIARFLFRTITRPFRKQEHKDLQAEKAPTWMNK